MKNRDERKKVLILDGGAAHAMAIAECLKNSGYAVAAVCASKNEYGYHCRFVDERFLGLDSHEDRYAAWMLNFLKEHHFDVLIPTSDTAAEFMSAYKQELQFLTGVLIPDKVVFRRGYDKNQLMGICNRNGYPHPLTIDLSAIIGSPNDLKQKDLYDFPYPALIKPNITSGARGMTIVNNYEEFCHAYPHIHAQYGDCHLQKLIPPGGKQVKVQIMTDENGDLAYSSVIWKQRFYPINGGSSCCNITIDNPAIVQTCADVLKSIGWVGFADFDLIENPETQELLIMEINPRIPACIRSVFKSGVDYATMIADMTLGQSLRNYTYQPGKRLRHLGFDVLWFMKSKDRFKAKPSWFNFLGKDLYYQDWIKGNFTAFLWGTVGNIHKLMNPKFRQAKQGKWGGGNS